MKNRLQKIIGAGLIALGTSGSIGGFYVSFPPKYSTSEFVQAHRLREEIYAQVNNVNNPKNLDIIKKSYKNYEDFVRKNNLTEIMREYDLNKKGSDGLALGGAFLSAFSVLTLLVGVGTLNEACSKK